MEKPHRARRLLARKLRLLRFLHNWTQEELAEFSGLHRTYISLIERAQSNISLDNIEKLADAFALPVHKLLYLAHDEVYERRLPKQPPKKKTKEKQ